MCFRLTGLAAALVASAAPAAAGEIRGRVLADGKPAGSVAGVFLLEGLFAGESYELQVMGPSGLGPRRPGVVAPAEDVELTVNGTGQVHGRVVDADSGRAIQDFQLRYQPDAQGGMRFVMRAGPGGGRGPYERQSFHAEDGGFVLEDVSAGRWTIEAFAPGYQAGSAAGVAVAEGELTEGVEIRLSKGGVVTGRVVESRSGRPILDASVRAELSGGEPRMGMLRMAARAASTRPPPMPKDATRSPASRRAPGRSRPRIPSGARRARASSSRRRPRPRTSGSAVAARSAGPCWPGGARSTAPRSRSRRRAAEAVMTGDETQEVQLTLAEGVLVRGVVSGLPDAQLAGVNVSAQAPDYFASTRTAAGGSFELSGVPEGTLTLRANAGDFLSSSRSAQATVTIGPGQLEATAEIVFEQGFRVDGHVTRGGRPVVDAMVMAFPEGGGRRSASGRSDESGGYVIEGLDAGRYTLTASSEGGAPIRKTVELSSDTSVDLEAPPARLAGTVVESGSGRPLGDVSVRIEEGGAGPRFISMASTDSSGRFAFEDVEPRSYRVSFQKPAYQAETRELTTAEDSDLQIELRRGEGIAIEARDGIFATPLRGLFVREVDGSGAAVFAGSVSLDSDGRGEVPSLRPGTYELRAESSGYAPINLHGVAVPSRELSLRLTPGGSLEIQAGPATLALPQAAARLIGQDARVYMWSAFTPADRIRLTGPVRRLENVAPGRYTLEVDGGERRDVTVTEGGRAVVSLP